MIVCARCHAPAASADSRSTETSGGLLRRRRCRSANALSSDAWKLRSPRGQKLYRMAFERGKPKTKLQDAGKAPNRRGTKVRGLLTDRLRDYNRLARLPNVKLYVDEGRSWFARSDQHFDLIQMSMVDTWAATGAGAFALSENALYTVEA